MSRPYARRTTIEDALIIGLLVFAPLALASVHTWAYCTIALISLILFDIHFLGSIYNEQLNLDRTIPIAKAIKVPISIGLLIFLAVNLLYIIPLPQAAVKLLSPSAHSLRENYMFDQAAWQTLSIYPRATISYIIKITSYIMVFLVILSKITQKKEQTPEEKEHKFLSNPRHFRFIILGALCSVLSILFHSLSDFNLHIPSNALYFTVILAIITGLMTSNGDKNYVFVNKLINSIIIIAFVIAVFGIIQKFSWNGKIYWIIKKEGGNFGPFVNYDHFSGYMGMCTLLAISVFIDKMRHSSVFYIKEVKEKIIWLSSPEAGKALIYLFMSIVMTASLFLSTSRGGILSFVAVLMIFWGTCIIGIKRKRRSRLLLILLLIILLAVIMILWLGPEETLSRFRMLHKVIKFFINERALLSEYRPYFWRDTINLIKDYPVVGTGLGTYKYIFPVYRTFPLEWGFLSYAHNDYLHLTAEAGGIGLIFILAFLLWYLRKFQECFRLLRERNET